MSTTNAIGLSVEAQVLQPARLSAMAFSRLGSGQCCLQGVAPRMRADAVAQQRAWRPWMREQVHVDSIRRLNLLADIELQHGHHTAAERLAHLAAELREARA